MKRTTRWRLRSWWVVAGVCCLALAACGQDATVSAQVLVKRAKHSSPDTSSANVVVWLKPLDTSAAAAHLASLTPQRPFAMVQRDKQFHPHVLAVPVGTAVAFPNDDPFFHNVFSLYKGERFDLGLYEAGSSRTVRFDRPGVSFVFCNIHPEMSAYILALDSPYYTVTDARGQVRISGVPPGRYRLQVWYERAESAELAHLARDVDVQAPDSQLGAIEIRESDRFTPEHLNKHGKPYDADRLPY